MRREWTEADKALLAELRRMGAGDREIMAKLGRPIGVVEQHEWRERHAAALAEAALRRRQAAEAASQARELRELVAGLDPVDRHKADLRLAYPDGSPLRDDAPDAVPRRPGRFGGFNLTAATAAGQVLARREIPHSSAGSPAALCAVVRQ
jgi:hypothetical protein